MKRTWMSRACGLALTLGLVAVVLSPAHAQEITVIVNAERVAFDQPPIEQASRVFVPMRGVFERLGAVVEYADGTIEADRGDVTVVLHVGSNVGYLNGYPVQLDVAPFIVGQRTLVPLRFISESLGATVDWNQDQETVYIGLTTAVGPPPPNWQPPYPQSWPPPSGWWRPRGSPPQGWQQGQGGVWYPSGGSAPSGQGPSGHGGHGHPTPRPTFRPTPRPTPRPPPRRTFHPYPPVTPTPLHVYTPRPTFHPLPLVTPTPLHVYTPRPTFHPLPLVTPTPRRVYTPRPTFHPLPLVTPTPLRVFTPRPLRTYHPTPTPTPTP